MLYSAFTYFLGFRVNSGEYKLMGLAPYGNPGAEQTAHFKELINTHIVKVFPDGSVQLNQEYFTYATGLRMINDKKWEALFGIACRKADDELKQSHCNMALAIQQFTEEIVLKICAHAKALTGSENLCLSGGVALNCVCNGKIEESGLFKEIYIAPAPGDAGGAPGAALAAYHIYFGKERVLPIAPAMDALKGSYLGPDIYEQDVRAVALKYNAHFTHYTNKVALCQAVAGLLSQGNIVGWVQGRMEFGPRALGGRSILADPRNEEMQKKLNLKIKYRESFRPFAPSVLDTDVAEYFNFNGKSPYMLLVHPVKKERRLPVPADYAEFNLRDKLYYKRSDLPAITHVDFSARIQTVHRETNPVYYELIQQFKALTGIGVLVNTSFNVRGEPIVCTAADAYRCFMRTEMDYLVLGNFVFKKGDCPEWDKDEKWKEEFVLD
jgi:carbamoyltransferase